MYVEERRRHILKILKQKKRVDVADLAGQLDISPETIRRDLNEMEADGHLKRTHGGAIYLDDHTSRPLLPQLARQALNAEKKVAIARKAASYINDGDVIALDNSTTVSYILQFIPPERKITLLTNSLQIIFNVLAMPEHEWTCISLGGAVHQNNTSTYGFLVCNALSYFRPHKLFMSCAGIDRDGMLTEGNLLETEVKRDLIQCSQKTYLLVDETKWGQIGVVNEGSIAELDYLITNASVDRSKLEFLRDKGIVVLFDEE